MRDAAAAGVDGVLIVDYPPEECEAFAARLKARGLDPIFLLAPTSTEQRMKDVGRIASGYVYYVSLKGVTGAGHLDTEAVAKMIAQHPRRMHGAAGRCRLRHSRRPDRPRGGAGIRRGGHRHPASFNCWKRRRATMSSPRPRRSSPRSAPPSIP